MRYLPAFIVYLHILHIALFFSAVQAGDVQKPNVLFLAVDDMNDWIGCMDRAGIADPVARTPNLDKLAARGVCFTNGHTAGVYCAPSRAAIFTGQFASTTGCYESALYFVDHPEIEPLQVSFQKAGYQTFGAGKLFHHPAGAIDTRGWTTFFLRSDFQRQSGWPLASWPTKKEVTGTDLAPAPFPSPMPYNKYNRAIGAQPKSSGFMSWGPIPNDREEDMADTQRVNWAVKKLKEKRKQPFFLGVGIYAPHFPNYCPQKYFDMYDRDKIQLPPYKLDDLDDLPERIKKKYLARARIHQRLASVDEVRDGVHAYLACISYADAMMGRVLDALAASEYADNTIVVFWSDHGYAHGQKFQWGKHSLWQRTSNVPFIWAGPGVARGQVTDVTVSLIDMYPTLAEMCGLPKTHQTLEGASLAATLKQPGVAKDREIYLPHTRPGEYAIINRDWRYIHYDPERHREHGEKHEELYHTKKDYNEWHNLADDPELATLKKRLRSKAPKQFAKPAKKRKKKQLKVSGDTFRWPK